MSDKVYTDYTDFFEVLDLTKVIQGEFLPESFFEKRFSYAYDDLKYEIMNVGAVGIIINEDSEYCILGISRKNDKTDFGLPGGKSDEKENIIDTLKREIFEETGLTVTDYRLVYAAKAIDRLCFTFICRCDNLNFSNKEEHLGVDLKWINLGDLFVKDYNKLKYIIDNMNSYGPEIYWKILNNFLSKYQKTTFSNYNFRTLRKLLDFVKMEVATRSPHQAQRIYGGFFKEVKILNEKALKEAKYMNMMDIEEF